MALTDHVIVLAHLQPQVVVGPPTVSYEEVLRTSGWPEEAIRNVRPQDLQQRVGIAGEAVISPSALHHHPSGVVVETAWACSCGVGLHLHHDFVLSDWAKHAGAAEGIDPDHLEKHAIQEIDGKWRPDGKPRVVCLCGERFESPEFLPAPALAMWEAHVRA